MGAKTAAEMAENATGDRFLGLSVRTIKSAQSRARKGRYDYSQGEGAIPERAALADIDSSRVESPLWHRQSRIIERANEALELAERAHDLRGGEGNVVGNRRNGGTSDSAMFRESTWRITRPDRESFSPGSERMSWCEGSIDSSMMYLKKFTENASSPPGVSDSVALYPGAQASADRNSISGERKLRGMKRALSAIGWGLGTAGSIFGAFALLVHLGPMKGYGISSVVLKPGDTLWELARVHLGSISETDILLDCNPGIGADPDFLQPGQRLQLPRKGWKRAIFGLGFTPSHESAADSSGSKREKSIEAASATRLRYQQRLAVEAGLAGTAITAGAAHVIFGDSLMDLSNSGHMSSRDALVSGLLGELNALSGNVQK